MCPHALYAHSAAAKSASNAVLYCRLWRSNGQDRQRFRRELWQDQASFCHSQGPTTDAIDLRVGTNVGFSMDLKKSRRDTASVQFAVLTAIVVYRHSNRKYQLLCPHISSHESYPCTNSPDFIVYKNPCHVMILQSVCTVLILVCVTYSLIILIA